MLHPQNGKPAANGVYVAYVSDELQSEYAERLLLTFYEGAWSYPLSDATYRGTVYGWVGPIAPMKFYPPDTNK